MNDKRGRWRKWIAPHLVDLTPKMLTRDDLENIRDAIDKAITAYRQHGRGEGRLSPKSGANVWGEVTVSFREMFSSKRRELRVLDVDLTAGVQPPDVSGGEKLKCYPHPSEALLVAACENIPLDWRETHMVAAYTYARPGELRVLEWRDVDLDGEQIRITKAWDYQNGKTKQTKTHENRPIPIHPHLLPLLRIMKDRAKGKGLVVPLLSVVDEQQGLGRTPCASTSPSQGARRRGSSASISRRRRSYRCASARGATPSASWAIVEGLDGRRSSAARGTSSSRRR